MIIKFKIIPEEQTIEGQFIVKKGEVDSDQFLLNEDFEVGALWVDGHPLDPEEVSARVTYMDRDYQVRAYKFDPDFQELIVSYKGQLTGQVGAWPYVKDQISPDFSLIRFESLAYPLFYDNTSQGLTAYLREGRMDDHIEVDLVGDQKLISSASLVDIKDNCYQLRGDGRRINMAIGPYTHVKSNYGDFHVLGQGADTEGLVQDLEKAHGFLSDTFGKREVQTTTTYIEIPDGLGQFVDQGVAFILTSVLREAKYRYSFIHEFTHLGWNPRASQSVQKCRFFDEAYSNYLTLRVMEDIRDLVSAQALEEALIRSYQKSLQSYDGRVAIVDYGKHDYGDQSYTIGALTLKALEDYMGRPSFDLITRDFLEAYRSQEVDFDGFMAFYGARRPDLDLSPFFKDWLIGTDGHKKFQ